MALSSVSRLLHIELILGADCLELQMALTFLQGSSFLSSIHSSFLPSIHPFIHPPIHHPPTIHPSIHLPSTIHPHPILHPSTHLLVHPKDSYGTFSLARYWVSSEDKVVGWPTGKRGSSYPSLSLIYYLLKGYLLSSCQEPGTLANGDTVMTNKDTVPMLGALVRMSTQSFGDAH